MTNNSSQRQILSQSQIANEAAVADKLEMQQNQAKAHADALCQKLIDMVADNQVDLDIRETVCAELEALVGLQ